MALGTQFLRLSLLALLALVVATSASAQSGGLRVSVFAEDGEAMPGATVTLTSASGFVAPTALLTDSQGVSLFPVLRAGGGYVVEVAMPGFATLRVQDLRVKSDETQKISLQLVPELRDSVVATARTDVVDLERTGSSTDFGSEFISNIPIPGRFYQNLLTLAPGVNDTDGDGNPNVHGARSRDFQAQVGGVNNVDPLTGQWLNYVNAESIEEIQVITAGAGVEFGRAQGGFARVIQKQGSNEYEGLFTFLFRSATLDGDGAASLPSDQVPDFQWLQPAIQFSGPIIKDRLWFRLSHEYIDREDPINLIGSVAVTGREQSLNADQITWQTSPRNKLSFQFQTDPLTITNFDISSAVPPEASRTLKHDGQIYTLNWVAPFSSSLLFDSLTSYQDTAEDILPSTIDQPQSCMVFPRFESLNRVQCLNTDINVQSGSFPTTSRDKRQRLTVRSTGTWFKRNSFLGQQRIKFGFVAENERYFRDLERRPFMTFFSFRPLFPPPSITGVSEVVVPFPKQTTGRTTGNNWAIFFEDQFRPHHTLAITAGLRFDREEISARGFEPLDPQAENDIFFDIIAFGVPFSQAASIAFTRYENINLFQTQVAEALDVPKAFVPLGPTAVQSSFWVRSRRSENIYITNNNLSPRLSIAWDPTGDGKTKIAASAGRYYDKIFLAIPLIEQEPGETEYEFIGAPIPPKFSPIVSFGQIGGSNPAVRTRVVDHDLRTPYQDEFTISAERAIATETAVKVTYIEREFYDQFQDTDINHTGEDNTVLNPGWGEILLVGNFNSAKYKAYVAELDRRFYRSWQMQLSYTWSESEGDGEDFDQLLGNLQNVADAERSFLSFDQRHIVRLNGVALTPWGFRLGGAVRWESGLPFSILQSTFFSFTRPPEFQNFGTPGSTFGFVYPTGKRNDQRNSSFWNFDMRVAKEFAMAQDTQLQVTAEVFNILNTDALVETDRIDGVAAGVRRFGRRWQVGLRLQF